MGILSVKRVEKTLEDLDLEIWVYAVEVSVGSKSGTKTTEYTVKMDTQHIHVRCDEPEGMPRRSFNWDDWMLENCGGACEKAAVLCAIACHIYWLGE